MIRSSILTLAFLALALPVASSAAEKSEKKSEKTATSAEAAAQNGYEISITGMTCGSCVNAVTKALQELPGVEKGSVKVTLKENKAFVAMAKQDVELEKKIKSAVEGAGFKVASVGWAVIPSTAKAADTKGDAKADAKGERATCKECGKSGHGCEHCSGKKGEKHTCSEGNSCKKDCPECKKAGHKHGEEHDHSNH